MIDNLKFLFGMILFIALAFGIIIALLIGLFLGCEYLDYKFDKSMCKVEVSNKTVYEGRCHFVSVNSVGENGNTKHVTIFSETFCSLFIGKGNGEIDGTLAI